MSDDLQGSYMLNGVELPKPVRQADTRTSHLQTVDGLLSDAADAVLRAKRVDAVKMINAARALINVVIGADDE